MNQKTAKQLKKIAMSLLSAGTPKVEYYVKNTARMVLFTDDKGNTEKRLSRHPGTFALTRKCFKGLYRELKKSRTEGRI